MLQYSSPDTRRHFFCCAGFGLLVAMLVLGMIPSRATAAQKQDDPLAGNPDLERSIQIHAEGIPVSDLLALLAKKTRIDLVARTDVVDDKVIVLGPSRPLKEVLADLAALFNDTWLHTRTSDGKNHYTLFRSQVAHDYEDNLASEIQYRMIRQLNAYIEAAKSPAPYEYEVYRIAAQILGLLSPEQKQQLLRRKSLNLPFDGLTVDEQMTARQAVNAIYAEDAAAAKKRNQEYQRPPDSELEQGGFRFEIQGGGDASSGANLHLFLTIGHAYSEDFGKLDDRIPWLLPLQGNPYTRKPVPVSASVPGASLVTKEITAPSLSWLERLKTLSEQTGAPILADYYRCQPPPPPTVDPFPAVPGSADRLALDQMGRADSTLWWVQGKTLLLRKRNWYTQRLYEVPDRWVLDLQKHLMAQKGIPTYGDVLRLTELTQAQMAGLRVEGASSQNSNQTSHQFAGIMGERTDENTLAGLPELLAICKVSYLSRARNPVPNLSVNINGNGNGNGNGNVADMRRAALTYNDMTEAQRSLVPVFLQAQRIPISLAESTPGFFVLLTRSGLSTAPKKSVQVALNWTQGVYPLTLPTSLVDDHHDKTEVKVIPPQVAEK